MELLTYACALFALQLIQLPGESDSNKTVLIISFINLRFTCELIRFTTKVGWETKVLNVIRLI